MLMIVPIVLLGVMIFLEIERAESWKKRAMEAEHAFLTLAKVHKLLKNADEEA